MTLTRDTRFYRNLVKRIETAAAAGRGMRLDADEAAGVQTLIELGEAEAIAHDLDTDAEEDAA